MRAISILCCVAILTLTACKPNPANQTANPYDINIKVSQIWSNGQHCAFTSIIKYHDKYYVTFREGFSHVFNNDGIADGRVRILQSADGEKWESVALLAKEGYDLRDPKLSITPDDKLMVIIGGSIYKKHVITARLPQVSFSTDGQHFTEPQPVNINCSTKTGCEWPWRVTWHGDTGYTLCYSTAPNQDRINDAKAALLKTTDGINYEEVTEIDVNEVYPNECTLRFLSDGRMMMMLRQEKGDQQGFWGISNPPYTDWEFKKMGMRLGGPDFLTLGDTLVIAGTRMHGLPNSPKTLLMKGNINGTFSEVCILPSAGDNSYPGLLVEGDELWVSYYSQHNSQKANIYLAKMPLSMFTCKVAP